MSIRANRAASARDAKNILNTAYVSGQNNRRLRAVKSDGIVRVGRETKGRKGKGVTLVTGVPLPVDELKLLAKELKQKCGTGGTLKDGVIEIQGDHRDILIELLKAKGWTVKKAGG